MTLPPLVVTLRCFTCRRRGDVEFNYLPDKGGFLIETPCSCMMQPPSPIAHLAEAEAVEEVWSPYVLWGGRPGYAVAPAGALHIALGWTFAAPYVEGTVYRILGQVDGVYVALGLDEAEWLTLERLAHVPCGQEPEVVNIPWITNRVFVGTQRERWGVVIFEKLKTKEEKTDESEDQYELR